MGGGRGAARSDSNASDVGIDGETRREIEKERKKEKKKRKEKKRKKEKEGCLVIVYSFFLSFFKR